MDLDNYFTKPERPFLLIAEDTEHQISYSWLETEEELIEVARELKSYGDEIINSIEIYSSRNIDLSLDEYTYEKLLEEVCNVYDEKSDCIIEIGMESELQIICTGDKFSCESINMESNDLDSIVAEIFHYTDGEKPSYINIKECG